MLATADRRFRPEFVQNLFESQILAAQDVALARFYLFLMRNMA